MHIYGQVNEQLEDEQSVPNHGEEPGIPKEVVSICTEICDSKGIGKSCAKIVLVDIFHSSRPQKVLRLYAIIDEKAIRL